MCLDALKMNGCSRETTTEGSCLLDVGSGSASSDYRDWLTNISAYLFVGSGSDSGEEALAETVYSGHETKPIRRLGPRKFIDDIEIATLT